MMKATLMTVLTVLLGLTIYGAVSAEEKGLQIAKENETANNGFIGEDAETEMVLINAQGDKTVRRMTSKTKETETDGDLSVITFLWPADVKGTRMLTHTHKNKDDDQWLYLPSLKRVKRISSRNKSGAFMGSEFAYEDLGSQEVEKYQYKWLRDEQHDGRDCWVLEQVPTDTKSGYSRMVQWVDKEYRQPLKTEYYDRKGDMLKTAVFGDYKKLKNFWRMHSIKMDNVQTRKSSIIRWTKRELTEKYQPEDFKSEALSEG